MKNQEDLLDLVRCALSFKYSSIALVDEVVMSALAKCSYGAQLEMGIHILRDSYNRLQRDGRYEACQYIYDRANALDIHLDID